MVKVHVTTFSLAACQVIEIMFLPRNRIFIFDNLLKVNSRHLKELFRVFADIHDDQLINIVQQTFENFIDQLNP